MTITKSEEASQSIEYSGISESIKVAAAKFVPQFDHIIRNYIIFNVLFLTIGFAECILLLFFFTFLVQSAILALSLAIVFLTFSSYFILRLYLQARKAEHLGALEEEYLQTCKRLLHYQEDDPNANMALANACTKLADGLDGRDYRLYYLPSWLQAFDPYIKKFSSWCHWNDVHKIQESLLLRAVGETIKFVKSEPTNLDAHAVLANAYVVLSSQYATLQRNPHRQWLLNATNEENLKKKFRETAERAIEEFKILNDFAPNDPWVHAQLAYSYRDLNMPFEEIRAYEALLAINPEDMATLFKLGVLYFQQGLNAQGLRVYGQLKRSEPKKASDLIAYYGAYSPLDIT